MQTRVANQQKKLLKVLKLNSKLQRYDAWSLVGNHWSDVGASQSFSYLKFPLEVQTKWEKKTFEGNDNIEK